MNATQTKPIKKGDYVLDDHNSLCKVAAAPTDTCFAGELITLRVLPGGKLGKVHHRMSPDSVTLCANPDVILAAMKIEQAIESMQSAADTTRQALRELLASVRK